MIPLPKAGLCVNHQPELVVEMINLNCPMCGQECIPLARILNRSTESIEVTEKKEGNDEDNC